MVRVLRRSRTAAIVFTYLALAVETAASEEAASTEIAQHVERLSQEEAATVRRLQVEKAIESSYAEHPDLLIRWRRG